MASDAANAQRATVTKKDLVDRIAADTRLKRTDVKKVVQAFLDEISNELRDGNRLEFRDFGVFEVKDRAPRMAQNPKTLERVPVPAKKTVKFKVGRRMQDMIDAAPAPIAADTGDSLTPEINVRPGTLDPTPAPNS